ncbi:hypothetical protein D9758_011200 [Tetrapyrgos nigripes]|uniref:Mitochondrial carrier n=1 Tax=Tetrapyrgos nigripes TaxID=182062 RepID=A0A8H5FZP8_9AGAR|nr:hypothetical protein D9758_011200 [Tetrapyrgos nigripes]
MALAVSNTYPTSDHDPTPFTAFCPASFLFLYSIMSTTDASEINPTVDFIAGTMGGIASLIVGFPFDTVKVRFQNPQFQDKYRSTFHAITTIVREERFVGLFRGITSPLAAAALMNGLVFSSYRFFLKVQLENNDSVPTLAQIALAGTGTGIVTSVITTPTELIKIRQQSLPVHTSASRVALDILRRQGIRGLYRGLTATALRDCGYGAYFFAYEATLRFFASQSFTPVASESETKYRRHTETSAIIHELDHQPVSSQGSESWGVLLFAGAMAGIAGWVFTFPLDVIKTRIQGVDAKMINPSSSSNTSASCSTHSHSTARPTAVHLQQEAQMQMAHSLGTAKVHTSSSSHSYSQSLLKQQSQLNPYRTTLSTIVHSYHTEGFRVFWKGLSPTLIRAIPVNMVTFAVFEGIVGLLG